MLGGRLHSKLKHCRKPRPRPDWHNSRCQQTPCSLPFQPQPPPKCQARLATDDAEAAKRHALQLGVAEVTLRGDMERQRLAPNPDEPTRAKSPMRKPDAAPSRKQLRRKSVVPEDSTAPATVEAPPVPQVDPKRLDVLARLGYVLRAQSQRAVAALCYLWRSHAQRATVEASRRRWEVEAQERQLELDRLQQDLEDHEAERAKP